MSSISQILLLFSLCGWYFLIIFFFFHFIPGSFTPEFLVVVVFCFVLFYDLYTFIKLFVLSIVYCSFVYCFPAYVQLSYCIFCSTLSYLKQLFWILPCINHRSPIFRCEYWIFVYFVGVMILWVHVPWSFVVLFF